MCTEHPGVQVTKLQVLGGQRGRKQVPRVALPRTQVTFTLRFKAQAVLEREMTGGEGGAAAPPRAHTCGA